VNFECLSWVSVEAEAMVKWLYKKKRRKTMLLKPSIKKEASKLLVYSKL